MKIFKKVIILVMCSSQNTYQDLEKSIKETWYKLKNNDVEVIFYKENNYNSRETQFDSPDLRVPCLDGFFQLGLKTLLSFEWVLENYNFDYIFRTNLGSFVNPTSIIEFVKEKPKKEFYCGIIGKYNLDREITYASGSGYFLSKDLVEKVVLNKQFWKHNVVDDVAIGELLSNLGVSVSKNAIRKNICDGETFYQIGEENVEYISDQLVYHIRLRSNDRNIDIQNMKSIFENLNKQIIKT